MQLDSFLITQIPVIAKTFSCSILDADIQYYYCSAFFFSLSTIHSTFREAFYTPAAFVNRKQVPNLDWFWYIFDKFHVYCTPVAWVVWRGKCNYLGQHIAPGCMCLIVSVCFKFFNLPCRLLVHDFSDLLFRVSSLKIVCLRCLSSKSHGLYVYVRLTPPFKSFILVSGQ